MRKVPFAFPEDNLTLAERPKPSLLLNRVPVGILFSLYFRGEFRTKYRYVSDADKAYYSGIGDKGLAGYMQMDNGALADAKSVTDGIKDSPLGTVVQMRVAQKQWFSDYGDGNDALPREKCFYKAKLPEDIAGAGPEMQAAGAIIGYFGNDAFGGDFSVVDAVYNEYTGKLSEAIGGGIKHDLYNVILGEMLYRRGLDNFAAAREALEKCEDKKSWMYLSRSADLERIQGNYDAAIAQFNECRALLKNGSWVRTRLVECLLQCGKYDEALALVQELVTDAKAQGSWMGNNKKAGGNSPLVDEGKMSPAVLNFYEPFCKWVIATLKGDKAGANVPYTEMVQLFNGLGFGNFPTDDLKKEFAVMPIHFGVFWFHKIYNVREPALESMLDDDFLNMPKEFVLEAYKKDSCFTHDIGIAFYFFAFALSAVHPKPESLSFQPNMNTILTKSFRELGGTRDDLEILSSMGAFHDYYSKLCDPFVCSTAVGVFRNPWLVVDSNICVNGVKHMFHIGCAIAGDSDPGANPLLGNDLLTIKGDKPMGDLLFDQLDLPLKLTTFSVARKDTEDLDNDLSGQNDMKKIFVMPLLKSADFSCFMLSYIAEMLFVDGRVRVALPMYQEALRQFPDQAKGRETMVSRMVACGFHCGDIGLYPAVIRYFKKWMRAFISADEGKHWLKAADLKGYLEKLDKFENPSDEAKKPKKPAKSNLLTRITALQKKEQFAPLFDDEDECDDIEDKKEAYAAEMGDPTDTLHKGFYKGAYAMALCRAGMFFTMNNETLYFSNMDFDSNRSAASAYLAFMFIAREVAKVGLFKSLALSMYKKDQNHPLALAFHAAGLTADGKKKAKDVVKCLEGVANNIDEYSQNEWLDIWDCHLACAVAGAVSCVVEGGDPGRFYDMCDGQFEAGRSIPSLIIKNTFKNSDSGSLTKALAPVWKAVKVFWWKDGNEEKAAAVAEAAGIDIADPLMQIAKLSTSDGAAGFPQFQFDPAWTESNMCDKCWGAWPPHMTDVDPIDMWNEELPPFPFASLPPLLAEGHSPVTGVFTKRAVDAGGSGGGGAAAAAPAPALAAEEKKEEAAPAASPAPAAAAPPEEKKEEEEKKEDPPKAAEAAPAASKPKPAPKKAAPAKKSAPASAPASSPAPSRAAPARSGGGGSGGAGPVSVVPSFVQSTRPLVEVPKPTKTVDELLAEFGPDKIRSFVSAQERKIASYRKTRRALVAYWNSDSVGEFIEALPFYGGWADYYSYLLRKKGVTGTDLLNATNVSTIQGWGIEDIGHQMRLLSEILKMRLRG